MRYLMSEGAVSTTQSEPMTTLTRVEDVDEMATRVVEASRPSSDLDAKSMTLTVLSVALLAVSLLTKDGIEVELAGAKLDSVDWRLIVIPLGVALIYLAIHLYMQWWSERQVWRFTTLRSVTSIQAELERHAKTASAALAGLERFNQVWLDPRRLSPSTFAFEHPERAVTPPQQVAAELESRVASEYATLRDVDAFKYIQEDVWKETMQAIIDYEVINAEWKLSPASHTDGRRGALERKMAAIKKFDETERKDVFEREPGIGNELMLRHEAALKRTRTALAMYRFRQQSLLVFPIVLAACALTFMIAQFWMRYEFK